MGDRFSGSIITAAIAAAVASAAISSSVTRTSAQAPAVSGAALQTPWGEPDLQGIWTDEFDTPLQRPAKYANQEFFTEAQRAELDKMRSEILGRFATERDINGAYNAATFFSTKRTGARTSKIVDPPNGRFPPLTPEAQKTAAAEREFRLALVQSTDTCKKMLPGCAGGKYDPTTSPRRAEAPPRYNTARMNRNDGPEDSASAERCLTGGLPEFGGATGSFRRIVQTPGGISIFYDVGQGQGWQRNIVMDGRPHLPSTVRQWFGDSRGRWEGDTLVVDVTNFSLKTDFLGSRENLHLQGPSPTRSQSKTRPCGRVLGPSSRSSLGRARRKTVSIPSRAASKATMVCQGCCMDGARKTPLLRRDEVPIPQPWTTSRELLQQLRFHRTRCSNIFTYGSLRGSG